MFLNVRLITLLVSGRFYSVHQILMKLSGGVFHLDKEKEHGFRQKQAANSGNDHIKWVTESVGAIFQRIDNNTGYYVVNHA